MYETEKNKNSIVEDGLEEDYSYYYNENSRDTSIAKIVISLLFLFGVVGVLMLQYPKLVNKVAGIKNPKQNVSAAASIPVDGALLANNPDENMGDFFYNEAGGENNLANNSQQEPQVSSDNENNEGNYERALNFDSNNEDNRIMVSLGRYARKNPFLPTPQVSITNPANIDKGNIPFEIIEPPTSVNIDTKVTNLMSAKITGILYDPKSPSAVVVIDGTDEFVKVGDKIFGYTISEIKPDRVVIGYGKNTFTASIGQLFSQEEMSLGRVVPNLEKKFGGSRM